ncbi:hypothetical protein, partial [uncultured Thiocystis sp.]|uniref:hypothetical protein n=1 Tax=uncultured Thiocystis sp. TaxID=1202134 RepID=UPI0025FDC702
MYNMKNYSVTGDLACLKKQCVETSQELITDEAFKSRHRKNAKILIRQRKLTMGGSRLVPPVARCGGESY